MSSYFVGALRICLFIALISSMDCPFPLVSMRWRRSYVSAALLHQDRCPRGLRSSEIAWVVPDGVKELSIV
jgi:hypothetical protein